MVRLFVGIAHIESRETSRNGLTLSVKWSADALVDAASRTRIPNDRKMAVGLGDMTARCLFVPHATGALCFQSHFAEDWHLGLGFSVAWSLDIGVLSLLKSCINFCDSWARRSLG